MQIVNNRDPDASLVPTFKNHPVLNDAKTAKEGRPIYDDIEVVQIHMPGNRTGAPVFPAHSLWPHWIIDPMSGEQHQITYAERFAKQYQRFKAKATQTKSGTPLDHLPFLTEARRAELRAQNVYTAEQLAAIDGQELKNLGTGGRDMKNRAMEFIAEAKTNAPNTQLAAELEALRARNAILEEDNEVLKQRGAAAEAQFDEMSEEALRKFIQSNTGHAPQGNLPHKTLIRMAMDARPKAA